MKLLLLVLCAMFLALVACDDNPVTSGNVGVPVDRNIVQIETSMGTIEIELLYEEAPATVMNFRRYVAAGFYDGLLIHRVIPDFIVQGGGIRANMTAKPPTYDPIENEANNGLSNLRGTIAMARTSEPQSATSQFFINLKDNTFLDYKSSTPQGWGYAVFGRVVSGMDVVDAIAAIPTGTSGGFNDVPTTPVIIESVSGPLWF